MKSVLPSTFITRSLMLLYLLITACEQEQPCVCGNIQEQVVYFEYRYVNHAWGYQEHGWLIDGAGVVKGYEHPADYRSPDSTGYISHADMVHNLSACDTILLDRIDVDVLRQKTALIPGAAEGEITQMRNVAADAGASVLSAYLFDEERITYRYVLLGMSGDWEQENLSSEAGELLSWLRDFGVFWLSD